MISLDSFELWGRVLMDETTSPTDSELLADSPIDLPQMTDSNRARQFYNTTFISSSLNSEMEESFTAHDNLIIPNNMIQVPSISNQQVFQWDDKSKCVIMNIVHINFTC